MTAGRAVAVAVDLPRLELDRPFTYRWPDEKPITGAYVSVPFHGRTVRGWVLGPTDDIPKRVLPVRRVLSRTPLFGERELTLYRWMSERYVAPLATVIGRAHPPRVASEEGASPPAPPSVPDLPASGLLASYPEGDALLDSCERGSGSFLLRPLPAEEAGTCLEAVAACLAGGRDALIVVPEAEPLPQTARVVADAFGDAALLLVGGDRRARYRAWLDVLAGRYRVVVGTRPAVFAPLPRLGLVWVNREAHPAHREERAPYHHVRDVALARARLGGLVGVLSAHCPSAEAVVAAEAGALSVVRAPRARERAAAPLVETVRAGWDEVSPRIGSALRTAKGAFLLVSRRGYGVARVCRGCGELARCGVCGGGVVLRERTPVCAVCGATAPCRSCGGVSFGIDTGGTEHVQERAVALTGRPVLRVEDGASARPPSGRVVVGTAAAVKDFGDVRATLVGVLDADAARRRAGLATAEQSLATWMEAAIWAGPKDGGGRVLVQTREPSDPVVQALVRWDPWHFQRQERRRRADAGFPPGYPVFRVLGTAELPRALDALHPPPAHVLVTGLGEETVSLVTLHPDAVPAFRGWVLDHRSTVTRVEADPQL